MAGAPTTLVMTVRRYISEGQLSVDDLAWRKGMADWVSLRELLPQATPPSLRIEPPVLSSSASQPAITSNISKSYETATSRNAPKKGGFASFLNRLLGKRAFANYEEVPTLFYRLANEKEYGPATLDRALKES
jgi:hypothetical protein